MSDTYLLTQNYTTMRKTLCIVALALGMASCSAPVKLTNTATHNTFDTSKPVAAVFADLEVSPTKISYFMIPSQTVVNGGYDNVVNSAVREALLANGNADVMLGLEVQAKYNSEGEVESITVTGYPAKYVNFRNPGDEYLKQILVDDKN